LFYTTVYAITLLCAFGVIGAVRRQIGGDDLKDFAGLAAHSPFLAAALSIFLLSLAGLPPLAGFFGKFYLFSTTLRVAPDHGLLWLVVLALFGSFVSLYYYLIPIKLMFVDQPLSGEKMSALSTSLLARATIAILAATVLALGLVPQALAAQIIAAMP